MVKRHLKSLNTPKTWDVARKENVFVTRPQPGAHPFSLGISINHILKKDLKIATITKDTQLIINNKDCLVNSKPVKNIHHLVGFMDVITLPKKGCEYFLLTNTTIVLLLQSLTTFPFNTFFFILFALII